jgi:uncharacterized membrane protein
VRAARLIFLLVTAAWIALLIAAPVAALGVPVSATTYAFGSIICHQRPERSFHIDLAQLPVCARCFGLYVGAAIGALSALGSRAAMLDTIGSRHALRTMLILAALPTAMTWFTEVAGLSSPSNVTRFIAALPLGVAVAVTVNYVGCAQPLRTGHKVPPTPI